MTAPTYWQDQARRRFSCFFYGDIPPATGRLDDPRLIESEGTDRILSRLIEKADHPFYAEACSLFPAAVLRRLLDCGILCIRENTLCFDSPIFIREDAPVLRLIGTEQADRVFQALETALPLMLDQCRALNNGFSPEVNLYHILCGMVMDGTMMDALASRGALSIGRRRKNGAEYLSILYEKCDELQAFSDGLLCSWNRLTDGECALQSFGDANGERFDLYRFVRLLERGRLPERFENAASSLDGNSPDSLRVWLPFEAKQLILHGTCDEAALRLLELFGYAQNGGICVPVFLPKDGAVISLIAEEAEKAAADAMEEALNAFESDRRLFSVRQGVPPLEIANELCHILFGCLNERIVAEEFAAAPPDVPGEGRFLRSVQIDA